MSDPELDMVEFVGPSREDFNIFCVPGEIPGRDTHLIVYVRATSTKEAEHKARASLLGLEVCACECVE
ncbi:hypothetical protein CKO28_01260 [Rhodovibrio sodomensis]|uniref:Uncharacterized protein n=1 Tax=Rhodovibrio sodomensis TaxID=1088 RepID=A0ABS1D8D6_9PROT|nr:hypothetical protein [Rhodovibrio sodomensis]MBK1666672.1 hypothetical protein [Rhodovibrio sodomensis]